MPLFQVAWCLRAIHHKGVYDEGVGGRKVCSIYLFSNDLLHFDSCLDIVGMGHAVGDYRRL